MVELDTSRQCVDGGELESEEDGGVGGVWIVGNVEEIKDEEGTREYPTRREVDEGIDRPLCRSEFWAHDEEKEGTSRLRFRSQYWAS